MKNHNTRKFEYLFGKNSKDVFAPLSYMALLTLRVVSSPLIKLRTIFSCIFYHLFCEDISSGLDIGQAYSKVAMAHLVERSSKLSQMLSAFLGIDCMMIFRMC